MHLLHNVRLLSPRVLALVERILVVLATVCVMFGVDRHTRITQIQTWLDSQVPVRNVLAVAFVIAAWIVVTDLIDLYREHHSSQFAEILRTLTAALVCAAAFCSILGSNYAAGVSLSQLGVRFFELTAGSVCLVRLVTALITGAAWARFHGRRSVLIVGTGRRAIRTFRDLRLQAKDRYRLLGFVDTRASSVLPGELRSMYLGSLDQLEAYLLEHVVDEVLIALPAQTCYAEIERTIAICSRTGIEAKYPHDVLPGWTKLTSGSNNFYGAEMVTVRPASRDSRLFLKRCLDIAGAFCGLILLSPVMLACAAAIKLTSPGPIFFAQERFGLGRRRFRMLKFRTMVPDAEARLKELESRNEAGGPIFKMRKDPRITPIGGLLRRTSLDELPQLINVLIGDMSLVGPRPMSVRDVSLFDQAWLMRRFSVKPGLTCLWQVNGRSKTTFHRWMELDMEYIDKWSLRLDAEILALTVPAVIKGSGAM